MGKVDMRKEMARLEEMSDKELSHKEFQWNKMRPFTLLCGLPRSLHPSLISASGVIAAS